MTSLVVLGATGSIGSQTLEVASRLGFDVAAVGTRTVSAKLLDIAREWPEAQIAVADEDGASSDLAAELGQRALFGPDAVVAVAGAPGRIVVNGIVGSAGLAASVAALEAGNRLALANKESLVAGGPVVAVALARGGGELIPIDSEHSAIWQILVGERRDRVRRLILTASGGPFRGATTAELKGVTRDEALDHPTWDMGPRITIDSATLVNKAFEVIEAHYLFGFDYDVIDVVVHPQSIVHSMVEFVDGAVTAELGDPDMRVPIQYAITYPERLPAPVPQLDLAGRSLTFEAPDLETFRGLALGYEAGRSGGSAPAVFNAADEIAVAAFLDGTIGFLDIAEVIGATLDRSEAVELESVEHVMDVDKTARITASELITARS